MGNRSSSRVRRPMGSNETFSDWNTRTGRPAGIEHVGFRRSRSVPYDASVLLQPSRDVPSRVTRPSTVDAAWVVQESSRLLPAPGEGDEMSTDAARDSPPRASTASPVLRIDHAHGRAVDGTADQLVLPAPGEPSHDQHRARRKREVDDARMSAAPGARAKRPYRQRSSQTP